MSDQIEIVKIVGKCQFEGCEQPAECIAAGRESYRGPGHPGVRCYCAVHARVVADEGNPEYVQHCPNCGCSFGVN